MGVHRPQFDDALVRQLVDDQFPDWAGLTLDRVLPGGSDHAIYRLGADLSVRVPRHSGAINDAAKVAHWLPLLAARLPLQIPEPVAVGRPGLGYPWSWLVCRWQDGAVATAAEFADSVDVALQLADFLVALRGIELEVPDAWRDRIVRGPISGRDAETRNAIAKVGADFDQDALLAVWEEAVAAEPGPQSWVHGDFHSGNLLARDGRISTVLDFGSFGYGDPAADLGVAYSLFTPSVRLRFREAVGLDDAAWIRARGDAIAGGVIAHAAYADTQPHIRALTTRQIGQALMG
ncbi:aminoglycoside phosphotransferase family protein [Microlunatus parietis]|uniref:Aminoglycoside phosphotransferase (APT) family kinase protein n=1 Tax=Microlunatus parietis TaxID=682979 RepID=A0A7Y9L991_9ACTN|nr:aminoglycoside phosphotransferase family protein [Microlunatus parietis]NYE71549.1 aminoglycoside phosphotransferase (APT) family kinase protein [Microlunatus parietis]